MEHTIRIATKHRGDWIRAIEKSTRTSYSKGDRVVIDIQNINEDLPPLNIVLLSCLCHALTDKGISGISLTVIPKINTFLENINFKTFYSYTPCDDESILNIWNISDIEKEVHAERIHDYFKKKYFKNKDLSALKLSVLELYYNVFDHAQANGNAYTFIKYDEYNKILSIAICDFGRGIANSIRTRFETKNDSSAITKALEDGVTIGSKVHNKGRGLGNILGVLFDDNALKIVSNKGIVTIDGKRKVTKQETKFEFPGTLIYFDVSMDKFDTEEIIDTFDF